ncbi:MAG: hypothetical protein ACERKN_14665 [Velocimicrobium sp.]
MSKTKIVILSLKEIIYTAIFIGLGLLLVLLLIIMFQPSNKTKTPDEQGKSLYHPGVYTSQITLGQNLLNLELVVDADHINSVSFVNLGESVTTMYPLMQPCLSDISDQLCCGSALSDVTLSSENQYTQELLVKSIDELLQKAYISSN